jgi:peptidoglycan hydrolase-like protein with peptidoglycan-binding domain
MTTKKTLAAVVLATGLATGTLAAGLALPVSTAAAAPAAPVSAANTATAASAVAVAVAVKATQALPPWPVLRQGANSAWPKVTVRSLQYLLNAHGAKLTADGVFGAKTKAAVAAFQRARHLPADGVASAKTWGALAVTVRLGSTGPAVRAVQDQANFRNGRNGHSLNVDGVFGPKTQAWVRAFQQAEGFKADGVVGPLTWQALVTESLSG